MNAIAKDSRTEILIKSYAYDYQTLIYCSTYFEEKGFSLQIEPATTAATKALTELWGIGGKNHKKEKEGKKDAATVWVNGGSDKTNLCLKLMNEWG